MNDENGGTLLFSLADVIGGREIGAGGIRLATLNEFHEHIARFLRGSGREVDLCDVETAVRSGSPYQVTVTLPGKVFGAIAADVARLHRPDPLPEIDAKRAEIILQWQELARKRPRRVYRLSNLSATNGGEGLCIDSTTDFRRREADTWVEVERYLFGRVVEAGGTINTNIHLVLEKTGHTLIVESPTGLLRDDPKNRLFHDTVVHVKAEQNLRTGELRDANLLNFADHEPSLDEDALRLFVERGTRAWHDVGEAGAWVDKLREKN